MTTTYTISFPIAGYGTFNGTFTVNNATMVIQNFYSNTNPTVNILQANACTFGNPNMYDVTTGFISTVIDNITGLFVYPYLVIFVMESQGAYVFTNCQIQTEPSNTTFTITPAPTPGPGPAPGPGPVPGPNDRFSLRKLCCSLYSNNAQVYYKPHSLAAGGVGTVRNSYTKARKT